MLNDSFNQDPIFSFIIPLSPVTKKNHGQIIMCKGHPIILPSKPFIKFQKDSKPFIPSISSPIDFPIRLQCNYFMPTKRKCDLVNLLQATCDILVHYNFLSDDNYSIISSFDGSSVSVDKNFPHTSIQVFKI